MIGRLGSRLPPELREDPEIASILTEGRAHPATVLYLSYLAALDEAGPAKVFDFSRATFADRWQMGARNASSPALTRSTERHGRMIGAGLFPLSR